ncbi:hypothetical protein WJX73_006512 [Symbiochloris irregularis]|uniref:Threonine aspartase n=1 Tax=Symbiochloris irregularis TaxID=706552 RepID=A0AAW1PJ24_9CHLO
MGASSFFVAVHVGAGHHSQALEQQYKQTMVQACYAAAGHSPLTLQDRLHTVAEVIAVLEDAPHVNAGNGSNLTESGVAECDASIMADSAFGSCGAVRGCQNPIRLAEAIACQSLVAQPLGRVPPIFLVGSGARQWALKHQVPVAATAVEADRMHVTKAAKRKWQSDEVAIDADSSLHDTAGCIFVDSAGQMAAGVSSGGIALKVDGRIGEAAMHGCGCWASSSSGRGQASVACSVTGVGEPVMRTGLARSCCQRLQAEPDESVDAICSAAIDEAVTAAADMGPDIPKDFGIIAARAAQGQQAPSDRTVSVLNVEFAAVHSARSLGFAYLDQAGEQMPTACILRQTAPGSHRTNLAMAAYHTSWVLPVESN